MNNQSNTVVTLMDEKKCIISGTTTIDGVKHIISNKFISCDRGLNNRSWGVTAEKAICPICFEKENELIGQLSLF